jgi:hypothetical protein
MRPRLLTGLHHGRPEGYRDLVPTTRLSHSFAVVMADLKLTSKKLREKDHA